nr:hypothetical protein 32 [bacterium]
MSIIWMDGFDHYGADKNNMLKGPYSIALSDGSSNLSTANPRTGTHCLESTRTNASPVMVRKTLPSLLTTVGVGFAIRYDGAFPTDPFLEFLDVGGSELLSIDVTSTGAIQVFRHYDLLFTAANALTLNTYDHVEIKYTVSNTAAAIEIRVNGLTVISGSGFDGSASGAEEVGAIQLRGRAGSVLRFDDLFIWDTNGTENNDFIGDKRVVTLFPSANTATAEWTGGYDDINEASPDDDSSYIEANDSTPVTSEFEFDDVPAGFAGVVAVQNNLYMKRTSSGSANVQSSLVSGSNVSAGPNHAVTTDYAYYSSIHETDPDASAPWTNSALNAAKLRIERTA